MLLDFRAMLSLDVPNQNGDGSRSPVTSASPTSPRRGATNILHSPCSKLTLKRRSYWVSLQAGHTCIIILEVLLIFIVANLHFSSSNSPVSSNAIFFCALNFDATVNKHSILMSTVTSRNVPSCHFLDSFPSSWNSFHFLRRPSWILRCFENWRWFGMFLNLMASAWMNAGRRQSKKKL